MISWISEQDKIIIRDLADFDPTRTFECGQCFRWRKLANGNWLGIAKGLIVEIGWNGRDLTFHNTSPSEFEEVWYPYFDFWRDYAEIRKKLMQSDPVMEKAILFGSGIRLLKQDFYEMLTSFILSQNNNIPRIKKIIECLSENFGRPIPHEGRIYYSFPSIDTIARLSDEELKCIRAGYRTGYIIKSARQIMAGTVDYKLLSGMKATEARTEMLKLTGVGGKVADCILLFSGLKQDIFPVDRWVVRVMMTLYPGCGTRNEEIAAFAREKFGDLSGIAQQYLFYYAREMKIGMKPN